VEILTDRNRVKHLLERYPSLRDNDFKLIANLWFGDIKALGKNPREISCYEFFEGFSKNEFTNPQSVIRLRCKFQEAYPHLRGTVWENRHKEQPKVIEDLKTLDEE